MELSRGKERVRLTSVAVPSSERTSHTYWQYFAMLRIECIEVTYAVSELNLPMPATVSMLRRVHSVWSFHNSCISSCART